MPQGAAPGSHGPQQGLADSVAGVYAASFHYACSKVTHHARWSDKLSTRLIFALLFTVCCLRVWSWHTSASVIHLCVDARHQLGGAIRSVKAREDGTALLDVQLLPDNTCAALAGSRVRLSWRPPRPDLAVGQRVALEAKLRSPWGTSNPGGFDYRQWLLGQNYAATGYVIRGRALDPPPMRPPPGLTLVHAELIDALTSGNRSNVAAADWQLMRRTGTVHLLVISGLHVGVVAGFVYLVGYALLRTAGSLSPWPPRLVAWVCVSIAVCSLIIYSGADPPVVRAGVTVTLASACLLAQRHLPWWRSLTYVALGAVFVRPEIVLRQGFWLSYGAVVCLLWAFAQYERRLSAVRGFVSAQGVLAVGMAPGLALTVGAQPLIAPFANLLVVPVVSLVAVPAAFAGSILHDGFTARQAGELVLRAADMSLALVWAVLDRMRDLLPEIGFQDSWRVVLAVLGAGLCCLPLSRRQRLMALFACLPMLLPNVTGLRHGEFRVTVLDVGQGSAAIIDTHQHRLVVDAGARYPSGFSMGEAVVVPALLATGPSQLDKMLISHLDIDHAGGMPAVLDRFPATRREACVDGGRWIWDGVVFTMLSVADARSRNDASCTLLVQNGRRAVYFAGDIERNAERQLRSRLPAQVDLLIAPHHGSRTSSSAAFVRHLAPRHVVFSAGRRNRYRHPHAEVVKRYQEAGAVLWTTGELGALVWDSSRAERIVSDR